MIATLKINNKFNFKRSLKTLKSSTLWGIKLKYNTNSKTWDFDYDQNNEEQKNRLDHVLNYGWESTKKDNCFVICYKCGSHKIDCECN